MTATPPLVDVRLSPDALHLEVYLVPETLALPTDALVALIQERLVRIGVEMPLTAHDLDARLHSCRRGTWITLLSGTAPTPPIDARVELLAPVPLSSARQPHSRARREAADAVDAPSWIQGVRHAVRAGTALARLQPGAAGAPGYDLLGRAIPARPPREARLPAGRNTAAATDGTTLVAACDGEVMLHNLHIDVAPMLVRDGDLDERAEPLVADRGVFVRGSVRRVHIVAQGDVYVQGNVEEAHITSETASITVTGSVIGSPNRPTILEAPGEITCASVLHGEVRAGGHVYVLAEARHSLVQTPGTFYLQGTIDHGLVDVQLSVGGGVIPGVALPTQLIAVPAERQHFRVVTRLPGALALHSAAALSFRPCTIVDLSTGGARCRLADPSSLGEPARGAIVQLKFALAEGEDQILAVARVSRTVVAGTVGLAFLQMTQRDHHRLTEFCLQLLMARRHSHLAARADRK